MNLSNLIALFHVTVLPFIVYFIYKDSYLLAMLLLAFSVLVDLTEKYFGEKHKTKSFIHSFSDKIVVLTLLLTLTILDLFPSIVLFIFIFRDFLIGLIRVLASRDDLPIRGEWYGKTIITLQFVLIFTILLGNSFNLLTSLLTLVLILLSLASVIHYSYVYGKKLVTRRVNGKKIHREKMVILANKKSGGYKDSYRRHLLRIFSRKRKAPIVYLPETKDMYSGIIKKIKDYKEVIIAGGDGSFEGALNYKPLQEKSLGFFPLGAGNAYYSYFYKGKRFEYLRSRFKFKEVNLDVLELQWDKGKVETLFLGLGTDAAVMEASKNKKHHKFWDYVSASLEVTFGPKIQYDFECTVDGKKYRWRNAINLIIGKVPYIGFGIRSLLGKIKDNDGFILGTACVNTHSSFFNKALRVWALLVTQLGLNKAPLVPLKGKEFIVRSKKPFPLQAGGEFLGYTKFVKVKVKRKQKVLMI